MRKLEIRKRSDFHKETEGISGNYRPNGSIQNPGKSLAQIIKQMAWECFVIYLFIYLYSASLQKEGFAVAYRDTYNTIRSKNFNEKGVSKI